MEKLHYSIIIDAPKEKVWKTMLEDKTYREWTEAFNQGSYYEGEWKAGSDIRFLGPEKDGTVSGMISRIRESRPFDFLSIQHLGEINHGKETMYAEGGQNVEAFENYTFNDKDGTTELLVDLDSPEQYAKMFNDMWPKALEKLKQISESNN
ncbi:MAG TPA: SRPBCC domain-containing protein [Verrucomicrobiae bacterium]|nr:SRPBCC domain-containing protein [Verrucomicrobiae bacterium]